MSKSNFGKSHYGKPAKPGKGTNGGDVLVGTDRHDKLNGKGGDDLITGGKGWDCIDGGKGDDTAFYSGAINEYLILPVGKFFWKPTTTLVVDTLPGRDGVDKVKNVELLQFADATYNTKNGESWNYAVNAALDPIAQDPSQPPGNIYAGTGIPATGWGIARNDDIGIELGLQIIYRQGPTVLSGDTYADGVLEYTVASGPQSTANGSSADNAARAAWSFQYSVATNTNGDGSDLNDFTFIMKIDIDPTDGVDYISFQLEPEEAPGAGGSTQSNFVWRSLDDPSVIVPVDDEGSVYVTQNSRNFAFGEYQAFLAAVYGPGNGFAGDHHFDFVLQALSNDKLVAQNHIRVHVDDLTV